MIKYDDRSGGTAYTWANAHLKEKTHMQFELLGLDDKEIPKTYEQMSKMVVEDITDNCKTLLCPAKFMDDIYRIWCETTSVPARYGDYPYDMYFPNEYKDYPNPELDFRKDFYKGDDTATPPIPPDHNLIVHQFDDKDMFELDLPMEMFTEDTGSEVGADEEEDMDVFKSLLDDYYVSVMRTDKA